MISLCTSHLYRYFCIRLVKSPGFLPSMDSTRSSLVEVIERIYFRRYMPITLHRSLRACDKTEDDDVEVLLSDIKGCSLSATKHKGFFLRRRPSKEQYRRRTQAFVTMLLRTLILVLAPAEPTPTRVRKKK